MSSHVDNLYTIASRSLQARQLELDTLSDNLANINTPGFKQRRITFQDVLNTTADDLTRGGAAVASAAPDFTPGPVEATGVTFDLAIDGPGFFTVQLGDGQRGYTRLGDFRPDAQGRLVNAQGALLVPQLMIPAGAAEVFIDPRGVVTVTEGNVRHALGRLQLARFANPEGLVDRGDGIYQPTEASGAAVMGNPAENGLGQILAQALEMSNVDATQQMVNLIRVQRSYGLTLKALQISDQISALTNQLIS